MAQALERAVWKKSSYSGGSEAQCVEAADLTGTAYAAVAVRDSKAPQGPALVFPASGWSSFVSAVRSGEFPAA
ncbi:DUF397 domain-containing protein [Streptomyces sp. NBC_01525]|uniref:DUF397 domain-containing protein n=2 Tax=Streptomyces TaxID=1883 RepID=A0A553ZFJ1_9ACTN|nr:DUF397 domain-containing protein [Streptomyces benahoarensis]TSB26664.1 DUF397 domain-containing protein [Streptomyces benahoarensis]TSB40231.1 DUF397 domain-containing protein [Streptomyces benahoarensis]